MKIGILYTSLAFLKYIWCNYMFNTQRIRNVGIWRLNKYIKNEIEIERDREKKRVEEMNGKCSSNVLTVVVKNVVDFCNGNTILQR